MRTVFDTFLLLALLLIPSLTASAQTKQPELFQTMQALDTQLFDAANHCDYDKLTAMVEENLEFYHDQGGLMLGRQAFLDSIRNNTCGKMIRELVSGTLQVYPIKDYGAMELGVHRFHHPGHEKEFPAARQLGMTRFLEPGAPEWPVGEAKFLQIWQCKNGVWKLTRVISYAHRNRPRRIARSATRYLRTAMRTANPPAWAGEASAPHPSRIQ